MTPSIPSDTPMPVTLTAQEWLYARRVLGRQPYDEVAGLLEKMAQQLDAGARAVGEGTDAQ